MADYELIPQAAIDKLVANPTVAPAFDSVFGAGRLLKYRRALGTSGTVETPQAVS